MTFNYMNMQKTFLSIVFLALGTGLFAQGWTKVEREVFYLEMSSRINLSMAYQAGDAKRISNCVCEKIYNGYLRTVVADMSAPEKNNMIEEAIHECETDLKVSGRTAKAGAVGAYLAGKWRDENSLTTYQANGDLTVKFDGQILQTKGTWRIKDGLLCIYVRSNDDEYCYYMSELDENSHTIINTTGGETYKAVRVK